VAGRVEVALPAAAAAPGAREALAPRAGRRPVAAPCVPACGGAPLEVLDLPARPSDPGPERASASRRRPRRDAVPGYDEHLDLLEDAASLPGVALWRAGGSVQGRALWALESTLPGGGTLRSHAKQTAWKPTLLINARHHGNEPSSTISAVETVRRHAADPAWAALRRRVNLVALPFENVDGGELSWRMHRDHPRWMLHAGRYNALGLEFRSAYGDPDHPSRESRALPALWRRWLPDIVVDDHGFPSHEWVQPFSGYIPKWPAYWIPRGLVYVYLGWVDDPRYPDHGPLKERVRALMEEETGAHPDIVAMNQRWAERYRTYAQRWMPETFPFEPYRSLLVYDTPAAPDPGGSWTTWGSDFGTLHPEITSLSFVTEVADETAQGAYMDACVRAHEAIDLACLRALAEADHRLERRAERTVDGIRLVITRRRPVVAATGAAGAAGASRADGGR
ncbi:MAG: M14 family metallopeptidase, partial [Chloroflexota bacterium]